MAKFCTKCGKELKDGVCPNCSSKTNEKTVVTTETTDIKESFMDCLDVFKKIFTKPFDAIKSFVSENKFIAGIIMAVVAAITSGIYKIATLKNMYSSSSPDSFNMNDLSDLFSSAMSGNLSSAEPAYFKEFMTTFAKSLAEYALIIIIGWLIISKLFKGTTSIKEMVSVVAISLSVVLIANLVNSILVFIDGEAIGYIRGYVSSIASILSYLILYGSVKKVSGIDENKHFISVASMCVGATIVMDIVNKIFN